MMAAAGLQVAYLLAGLVYNLVSLVRLRRGGRPLAPTSLPGALVAFGTYTLVPLSAMLGLTTLHRAGSGGFALLLGLGGIVPHLRRGPSGAYHSRASWATAILINVAGLCINLAGALYGP